MSDGRAISGLVVESPSAKVCMRSHLIVFMRGAVTRTATGCGVRAVPILDWVQATSCRPPRGYFGTLITKGACAYSILTINLLRFHLKIYIYRDISVQ